MVHFDFFCFCVGSRRGLRTALESIMSACLIVVSCTTRQGLPDGLIKDCLEVSLGQCRALEVFDRLDLLGAVQSLLIRHGRHALLGQTPNRLGVLAKIELGANKDDRDVGGVVVDLGVPLPEWLSRVFLSQTNANGLMELTFALTLSNDGGLTMEKQMRNTSVWG